LKDTVTDLIDFDVAEETDEVHHGRVELETQVGRADVIADAEEALKDQRKSHRLKTR
jgi:hypothetical protein